MPITLAELREKTATVDVYRYVTREGFEAGDVNVTYRILTDKQDPDLEKRRLVFQARSLALEKNMPASMEEAASLTEQMYDEAEGLRDEAIKMLLQERFISWDIMDGEKPVPLIYEVISKHPLLRDILNDTLRAIRLQAASPNLNGQQSQKP